MVAFFLLGGVRFAVVRAVVLFAVGGLCCLVARFVAVWALLVLGLVLISSSASSSFIVTLADVLFF